MIKKLKQILSFFALSVSIFGLAASCDKTSKTVQTQKEIEKNNQTADNPKNANNHLDTKENDLNNNLDEQLINKEAENKESDNSTNLEPSDSATVSNNESENKEDANQDTKAQTETNNETSEPSEKPSETNNSNNETIEADNNSSSDSSSDSEITSSNSTINNETNADKENSNPESSHNSSSSETENTSNTSNDTISNNEEEWPKTSKNDEEVENNIDTSSKEVEANENNEPNPVTNNQPIANDSDKIETNEPKTNLNSNNDQKQTAESFYNENPNALKYNNIVPEYFMLNSNNDYIDLLRKRSFSLLTFFNDGTYTAGTLWLLDYKVIKEREEYKLFFGTNYHVAVELFSENDYPEYKQPNREKAISRLFIGKGSQNQVANGKVQYMEIVNDNFPRTFFLARNFMDERAYSNYDQSKTYYTDFAVIEWDFKVSKYSSSKFRPIVKQLVVEAPQVLDDSINKVETHKISMFNNSLPYANLDYRSFWEARQNMIRTNDANKLNEITTYEKAKEVSDFLTNIFKDDEISPYYYKPYSLYSYGFPSYSSNRQGIFSSVLDSDLASLKRTDWHGRKDTPFLPIDELHNKQVADHGAKFNGEDIPYFYGIAYKTDHGTKAYGGISGSLVLNQDGLPIGLLFGNLKDDSSIYLSEDNKYVINHSTLFIQFVQSAKLWNANGVIYPYNLIDGRDKNKYELQTNSYKEQLEKVYGENYSTALFPS